MATAPASPPPQRRQPTVSTPASAAVSRWSEAAWRPGVREREERLHGRRHPDHLGLRRPAPPHGDHDDAARAGRETRQVPRDRRLPDSLAGTDDRERRRLDRREDRWLEAEVRRLRTGRRARARGWRAACARRGRARARRTGRRRRPGEAPRVRPRRSRAAAPRSPRRRAASRCRRRAPRRRRGRAAPRGRRGRPAGSARRRSRTRTRLTAVSSPPARSGPCTSRTRTCRPRTG